MPELIDEEKIDSFHERKDTDNDKINLTISFEEEDSDVPNEQQEYKENFKENIEQKNTEKYKEVDIE